MPTECPSGIVTLVFTDIEGSTELWERHHGAFKRPLDEHSRVMRDAAARWSGLGAKTEGDSHFFAFGQAARAVQFAVHVQRTLQEGVWADPLPGLPALPVR